MRGPDPERLKAVWSQASDKAALPAVNSLEAMDDDLTALPFILHEVKSEDGGTPPPPGPVPSRMSLHDVTRAFQQVPSPPTNSATTSLPPAMPVMSMIRPPPYAYATAPHSSPALRSPYGTYPSPMMAHSPSPNMVYAHSMTSPVNGASHNGHMPVYTGQPLWIPAAQSPGGVIRPIPPSPYATPMVQYASPGAYHTPTTPSQNQAPQSALSPTNGRGRGTHPISPAVPRAVPIGTPVHYPANGLMIHSPSGHVNTTQSYFSPPPIARGQPRNDQSPISVQHPSTPSSQHPRPYITPGYTPIGNIFSRPTW